MELWVAVVLLVLSIVGIVLSSCFFKKRKAPRVILTILFIVLMLAAAVYIGLTAILLDAAKNKPPMP